MTEMATHLNPVTGYAPYQSAQLGWTYDSFGNYVNEALSGTTSLSMPQPAPYRYTGHSLLYGTDIGGVITNRIDGYNYDAAGNQLSDPVDGPNTYVYDAENRVASSGNGSTTYIYDAEGQRVAKVAGGVLTNQYLLDLDNEQVTELDGNSGWLHSNAYAAGKLLATYDNAGLHFQFSDWLGSRRVQADGLGNIEETCLNLPFGDMLNCSGPGSDATEQHFTGKFHDNESGLDYFGARYLNSGVGRWMSPDWADKPEAVPYSSLGDPQSLNLYGYVLNNPLSHADSDGHCCDLSDVVNFIAGAANAYGSDNLLGAGRVDQTTAAGRVGAAAGDLGATITGGLEVISGLGGEVGGLALDVTGVGALVGVPVNVVSAGIIAHGGVTAAEGAGHLLFSKRTGDFTKGEKNAMDSKNAAENGGVNKCTECGQEVQKVQNKKGEPTPGNQLQRHHDPPLSKRAPRTKSPRDRIMCKECHAQEHKSN